MEKLREENLFVDDLDGKWTLGFMDENGGSQSIGFFDEEDSWLYPDELGFDHIINVYLDEVDLKTWHFNVYDLPDNWRDIVTNNRGKDGKKSIHDIMIGIT